MPNRHVLHGFRLPAPVKEIGRRHTGRVFPRLPGRLLQHNDEMVHVRQGEGLQQKCIGYTEDRGIRADA